MKCRALSALIVFSIISSSAFAGFLKEGGYLGKHNGKDKVDLLLKSAPGRDGGFVAVLIKEDKKVSLYRVDELEIGRSYAMVPLQVVDDGEIGVENDDPSLVISMAKDKDNKDVFKIMSANSSNKTGFNGFFVFEGEESKFKWLSEDEGEYKSDDNKHALQISQFNETQREATAVFITKEINGAFTLAEKFPAMYLINQNSVTSTGEKRNEIPSAIGIFLKERSWWGGTHRKMLLVNPRNDTDIKEFVRK